MSCRRNINKTSCQALRSFITHQSSSLRSSLVYHTACCYNTLQWSHRLTSQQVLQTLDTSSPQCSVQLLRTNPATSLGPHEPDRGCVAVDNFCRRCYQRSHWRREDARMWGQVQRDNPVQHQPARSESFDVVARQDCVSLVSSSLRSDRLPTCRSDQKLGHF